MASASTEQLAAVPLFSALTKPDLQQVLRAADEIDVESGRELVTEGRVGHEFFLIISGKAAVKRNNRKVTDLGAGQYFGELALLDRGPRSASVVAETPMTLLVLHQREFNGVLDGVPGMASKILSTMAQRLREADTKAASVTH